MLVAVALLVGLAAHETTSAATLRDFGWLNSGITTSTDEFRFYEQCTLADVEGAHGFKTGGSWPYLWEMDNAGGGGPAAVPPPLGMRSAAPLGGLGTGTVELRADGSFCDWQLENQGPGLVHQYHNHASAWPGGKVDKPEFLLGLRVVAAAAAAAAGGAPPVARTLRTAPPAGLPSVAQLNYSGAYPAAQLRVEDAAVLGALGGGGSGGAPSLARAVLRVYAPLVLRDAAASNTPALVLELELANGGSAPVNASFLAVLPAFQERDQGRINRTSADAAAAAAAAAQGGTREAHPQEHNASSCRRACAVQPSCAAWTLSRAECRLANASAAARAIEYYEAGSWSGVAGAWSGTGGGGLLAQRPGDAYFSGTQALLPIAAADAAAAAAGTAAVSTTVGVGDSLQDVWARFAATGGAGAAGAGAPPTDGGYGAATVTRTIGAGEVAVLRIVLAWHFPHRFHFGGPALGNRYAARYEDAAAVAADAGRRLADGSLVRGVQQWHDTCLDSSLPVDWRDLLVNSLGALAKTSMWFETAGWRQLESFSDDDPDPAHIHLYRSIPYAAFFPELSRSLLLGAYAASQNDFPGGDGYVHENFPLGGQTALGRAMGDTSTAFVLDVYQLQRLGGANESWRRQLWPHVKAAAGFQLGAAARWGLPSRLDATYDWFGLALHDATSYNGFLHVAALRAAAALGGLQGGEAEFVAAADAAAERGEAALERLLWRNASTAALGGYYAATWDHDSNAAAAAAAAAAAGGGGGGGGGGAGAGIGAGAGAGVAPLLSDSLYGALWAAYLGLPAAAPPQRLLAHLASERRLQGTPFGLRAWFPPNASRADRGDAMVWNGGSFSHAALALYLGEPWGGEAVLPAEQVLGNFKHALRDWWDFKDLTSLGGSGYNGADGYRCASAPPPSSSSRTGSRTGSEGAPWCNSHYTRQLIGWAVPAALSGQQFDAARRTLRFRVQPHAPRRLPVFTSQFSGTLDVSAATLRVHSGALCAGISVTLAVVGDSGGEAEEEEEEEEVVVLRGASSHN